MLLIKKSLAKWGEKDSVRLENGRALSRSGNVFIEYGAFPHYQHVV